MNSNPQFFPPDLFSPAQPGDAAPCHRLPCLCVRTRPRWEKRFAAWLLAQRIPYYLPLVQRRTVSYRKVRTSTVPLFPGYVFVWGQYTKAAFTSSGCVVRLLAPRSGREAKNLIDSLRTIERLLASGALPEPARQWEAGQRVTVRSGPLEGTTGEFIRDNGNGRLVIRIDLLGLGVAVTLPPDTVLD